MSNAMSNLRAVSAVVLGVLSAAAHADVLDFDSLAPSTFGAGSVLTAAGYTLTLGGGSGEVALATACSGGVCPTNDPTQAYFAYSNATVTLARADGTPFTITSFDAAFVPAAALSSGASPGNLQLLAVSSTGSLSLTGNFLPAGTDGSTPFGRYDVSTLTQLQSLTSLTFSACALGLSGACSTDDLSTPAQFALDNIDLTAVAVPPSPVPEPSSMALVAAGFGALAWRMRRRRAAC